MRGLVKGAAFNGRMGHVLGLHEGTGKMRFRVRLDSGEEMNVLPENLDHVTSESRRVELKVGRSVRVAGLRKSVEYNGMRAKVVRSVEDAERYVVRLEQAGGELKLQAENLDVLPPAGLEIGQRVKIRGLVRRVQYNGLCGSVLGADWNDDERIIIGLDVGGELRIKAANIDLVDRDAAAEFEPGRRVRLKGLVNKEHLNGKIGTVQYHGACASLPGLVSFHLFSHFSERCSSSFRESCASDYEVVCRQEGIFIGNFCQYVDGLVYCTRQKLFAYSHTQNFFLTEWFVCSRSWRGRYKTSGRT